MAVYNNIESFETFARTELKNGSVFFPKLSKKVTSVDNGAQSFKDAPVQLVNGDTVVMQVVNPNTTLSEYNLSAAPTDRVSVEAGSNNSSWSNKVYIDSAPFNREQKMITTTEFRKKITQDLKDVLIINQKQYDIGKLSDIEEIYYKQLLAELGLYADNYLLGKTIIGNNPSFDPTNTTVGALYGFQDTFNPNTASPNDALALLKSIKKRIKNFNTESASLKNYSFYCTEDYFELLETALRENSGSSDLYYKDQQNLEFTIKSLGITITSLADEVMRGLSKYSFMRGNTPTSVATGCNINDDGSLKSTVVSANYIPLSLVALNNQAQFTIMKTDYFKRHDNPPSVNGTQGNSRWMFDAWTLPLRNTLSIPVLTGDKVV